MAIPDPVTDQLGMYRAVILLLTGGMIVLHALEWRAVPFMVEGAGSGAARLRSAQRPRLAVRLEVLYYVAASRIPYMVSKILTGRLMMIFAVCHWGGLALLEATGFWRNRSAWAISMGARRMAAWSIAALDLAEVVVLVSLGRALQASSFAVQP